MEMATASESASALASDLVASAFGRRVESTLEICPDRERARRPYRISRFLFAALREIRCVLSAVASFSALREASLGLNQA